MMNDLYKTSIVFYLPSDPLDSPPITGTLIQYAAENADINVNTLDGNNTLYIMDILKITNPTASVLLEETIPRITDVVLAQYFAYKLMFQYIQYYQTPYQNNVIMLAALRACKFLACWELMQRYPYFLG